MKKYFKVIIFLAVVVLIVGASTLAIKPNHVSAYCLPTLPPSWAISSFSVTDATLPTTVTTFNISALSLSCNGIHVPYGEASIVVQGYPSDQGGSVEVGLNQPESGDLNISGLSPGIYTATATVSADGTTGTTGTTTFTIYPAPTYTVSTSAGTGGTISGSQTVNSGSKATITAAANSDFSLSSISGCGSLSGTSPYTTPAITGNCTVTASFTPLVMSGSLNPPTTTCTIASGASSCNVSLTWSITNPTGNPTAITATGMTNVNVTTTLASPQLGTQSLVVPYAGRTFYLYNNGLPLDQSTATASCDTVNGYSWNGSSCAIVVNGSCSTTIYGCKAGTPANTQSTSPNASWNCNGSGGGTNASCAGVIPPPTNLTSSCSAPGTTANLSWNLPSGYSLSYFRVADNTAGGNPSVWIPENVSDTGPATSFASTPGHNYEAWVHTRLSDGSYSDPIYNNFTCPCSNGASNPPTCTTGGGGSCLNGANNPPTCSTFSVPTVTTAAISNANQTTATSGGSVTSNGGVTVTVGGIAWSTDSTFNSNVFGTTHTGWADYSAWADNLTGLIPGTKYYVRAYAINSVGTGYGSVFSFTTSLTPGGWGGWSAWSACSASCGPGTQTSINLCNNPTPANGGQQCLLTGGGYGLEDVKSQACNLGACAGPVACSSTHYKCTQGTVDASTEKVISSGGWSWTCDSNPPGATASCTQVQKKPVYIEK